MFLETNIKYRESPGVLATHRRLGLARKKENHVDSILESAKILAYNAFKPRLKEFSYEIHTFADKENKFSLDYRIKTDNLGFVTHIESRASGYLDMGITKKITEIRNFLCVLCEKIEIPHPIPKSDYANTGRVTIDFPIGREKSIRFKLGLAASISIHSKAVLNHATALEYKITENHPNPFEQVAMVQIETGSSLFGRYVQSFELHIDENGWIKSIIEKRLRCSKQTQDY